jgi:OFA family oxalate/formate antiporter-like MFS transporter
MTIGAKSQSGIWVLLACMILTLSLGSVHAFSVFLETLEGRFNASRSDVSLIYSFALASITVSVLFGHFIYNRLHPVLLVSLILLFAAAGCAIAGQATNLQMAWLGYSVLFGSANGFGYGFALKFSAQSNPDIKGFAMGCVTATYALGAAVAPVPFKLLLNLGGFTSAMNGLAIALLIILLPVTFLVVKGKAQLKITQFEKNSNLKRQRWLVVKLWLGYGTAVATGLMIMGHATGIAKAGGLNGQLVVYAPIVIAIFNMFGSLMGGWLADRAPIRLVLMAFPAFSVISLLMISLFDHGFATICGLAFIGFAYGATIVAYPAAVSSLFGVVFGVRVYGQIFTAWGIAGLLAPWFAGILFERFGDYKVALALAAAIGLASLVTARFFPANIGINSDIKKNIY